MHLGKPLSAYELSCSTSTLALVCVVNLLRAQMAHCHDSTFSSGSVDLPAGGQTPAVNVVPSPHREELSSPGQTASAPCLVSPVLAFIKTFRLQGDVDIIKRSVCENFSSELVEAAKKALWDHCGTYLEATSLSYHVRRGSGKLSANVDDVLKTFEVLDGTDSIPSIFCEATDLPRLPPISLDPVGEQVQSNTQALHTLGAAVSGVEDKLAHLMEQIKVLLDSTKTATTRESVQTTTSFAKVVSSHPPSVQPKSTRPPPSDDSRASNVVLFGLPQGKSIFESKAVVDEVFEFLAGRLVAIKDIFRLGKFNHSSHPRPLLVKLSAIWDRKLFLSRKKNLRDFRIKSLFCVRMFLLSINSVKDLSH